MIINIKDSNLPEDYIESIQNNGVPIMYLHNNGNKLDAAKMNQILEVAKEMGPFFNTCGKEQNDYDRSSRD